MVAEIFENKKSTRRRISAPGRRWGGRVDYREQRIITVADSSSIASAGNHGLPRATRRPGYRSLRAPRPSSPINNLPAFAAKSELDGAPADHPPRSTCEDVSAVARERTLEVPLTPEQTIRRISQSSNQIFGYPIIPMCAGYFTPQQKLCYACGLTRKTFEANCTDRYRFLRLKFF